MCIICYAPKGVKVPEKRIRNMFENNSHGSGIMWKPNYRSKVQIRKGFMTIDELIKAWNDIPTDCEKAIHCRIATAGKIGPACCHPFPIRKSVDRMRNVKDQEDMALMHNGIISYCNPPAGKEGETSDTMNFAADVVYPLRFMLDKQKIKQTLEEASNSKILIFRRGAKSIMLGKWIEADGAFYTNTTYSYEKYSGWGKYGCSYGGYGNWRGGGCYSEKKHNKNKITNIYENEIYETDVPIDSNFTTRKDVPCIPVWTMFLNIDDKDHTNDKFFEEVIAYAEDCAENMTVALKDSPYVVKFAQKNALKVSIIGSKPRDTENINQLFGLEVLYTTIDTWITEDELWSEHGLIIDDLNLTDKEFKEIVERQRYCKKKSFKENKQVIAV